MKNLKFNKEISVEKIDPFQPLTCLSKKHINPFDFKPEIVETPKNVEVDLSEVFARVPEDTIIGMRDEIFVSNKGQVYNNSNHSLFKGRNDKDGYLRYDIPIIINGGLKYTAKGGHKLVLLAFDKIPDAPNSKLVPNHLDGNVINNDLDNLEWTSNRGNGKHAVDTGLHKMNGEDNPNNKLKAYQVEEICQLIETGKYFDTEIAKMYGTTATNILDMRKGKIWKDITCKYDMTIRKARGLTPEMADKLCQKIETNKFSDKELAEEFEVTITMIRAVKRHKCWNEVSKKYNF